MRGRDRMAAIKIEHATRMRWQPTEAEERLWRALRGRYCGGLRFRRQAPLFGYIADFLCPTHRLVVEVDGPYHAERAEKDAARDGHLLARGYLTLRVTNDDVMHRRGEVCRRIKIAAATHSAKYAIERAPRARAHDPHDAEAPRGRRHAWGGATRSGAEGEHAPRLGR